MALAIIAGIAAALLSSTSPRVHHDGQTASCTALLVAFEADQSTTEESYPAPPSVGDPEWDDYQLARACDRQERQWGWLAGLAALVCLAAASVARFGGRGDDEGVLPEDRVHESV